jgi:hypothetical protein
MEEIYDATSRERGEKIAYFFLSKKIIFCVLYGKFMQTGENIIIKS